MNMLNDDQARIALLETLRKKSVFHGDFTLASGAKSNVYVDCRLTTFDPAGALLVGQLVHAIIRRESAFRKVKVDAVGGLTMGADPISLATGMHSVLAKDDVPLKVFAVRKAAKDHGKTKLIEGNFKSGDTVVVVDDVVTRGDSTINAINAVTNEGGKVAFVVVLVDREEGGRLKIEAMGHPVFAVFRRAEVFGS